MWLVWFAMSLLAAPVISQGPKPHIIFILADDLGWNDVSFHGSDQIPTPNIDSLAYNGVILNRHYVQPLCTPSRSALMTGMYPISLGMQGSPMLASEPRGLPLGKILPQYLKDLGYVNRIVGKWHLGFYKKEYTPLYRGFDSHLGYWAGSISYYDHIVQDEYPGGVFMNGHDFRRNMSTAWDLDGQYATDVFTNEAVNIISRHPSQTPLFLYVSHLAVHAGNMGKLIEAPQSEIDKFRHIHEPNRRTYAAMVSKLDESVGKIMKALQTRRMLQNSIIVFLADNGAPSVGIFQNWGSNYPLRGMKATLWEGGVRGVGLVWSPLIKKPHRVSNELMHISDWLPTLYHAAGGNVSHLSQNVTGKDQWDAITKDETSPRKELLVNIDEVQKNAAIIQGDWKLMIGSFGTNGSYDTYLGDSGSDSPNPAYTPANLKKSDAWQSVASLKQFKPATDDEVRNLRQKAADKCNNNEYPPRTNCNPSQRKEPCLFNLAKDPCEVNNVARTNENIARRLYSLLLKQKSTLVNQINQPFDLVGADPRKFNNTWSPWLD